MKYYNRIDRLTAKNPSRSLQNTKQATAPLRSVRVCYGLLINLQQICKMRNSTKCI